MRQLVFPMSYCYTVPLSAILTDLEYFRKFSTVKTLNIGTPRLTTVVVLNIKQFNFTMQ